MIKRLLQCAGAVAFAALSAHSALAATLQVVPSVNQIGIGSSVQISVRINDLVDLGAPSLGAYDLDIHFDPTVLSFSGVTWGDALLGDQLDLAQLGSFAQIDTGAVANGKLNLFEFSYDDIAALNNTQAGSFTLFSLTFDAVAAGLSPISIDVNALGDANGNALAAQVGNASVSAVPVPAALPLFASALLVTFARKRRHRA
jgi:Cohesin domain